MGTSEQKAPLEMPHGLFRPGQFAAFAALNPNALCRLWWRSRTGFVGHGEAISAQVAMAWAQEGLRTNNGCTYFVDPVEAKEGEDDAKND